MSARLQDNLPVRVTPPGLLYRFLTFIIRLVFFINGGLHVSGKDNIPAEGGVIVASNHISYLDPPLLAAVLPRRATFIARKGLFTMPVLGWFIKHFAFPVDRERTQPSTIKEAVKRLKSGEVIVMFPEGRRSETGELLEGKRGVGMVASMGNVPIVPTLILDSDKALPVGARWLKRAKISVIFGRPIDPSTVEGEGDRLYDNISKKIMSTIGDIKIRYADNSC